MEEAKNVRENNYNDGNSGYHVIASRLHNCFLGALINFCTTQPFPHDSKY